MHMHNVINNKSICMIKHCTVRLRLFLLRETINHLCPYTVVLGQYIF